MPSIFTPIRTFRHRLKAGHTLVGAGVTFSDPLVSEALADGVDFLWIDLEHSAMSPEVLNGHLLAARGRGTPAIVRVAGGGAAFLKPVLDAGATGIIVPQVRSADEVRAVVADCRYPPQGRRGFGPRVPTNYGGYASTPAYVREANRAVFVSVMIETREALEEIEEIVAIPGLDSVVIGPTDLSGGIARLGDVRAPAVTAAVKRIVGAARKAGKPVGAGMGTDPEFARHLARLGVQWLQVGGDYRCLIERMGQLHENIRC